ncbi:MAG: 3-phosphoserine/phosphohydroxythreonine transaminase [Chitinophagaceae bacterium]|nr:3-phosphoserine/phosphohydroxythreonine transaminase [Chitinophagaceae bacterium]
MIHNFNAGPSILPKEVFEEASRAILNFNETGLSILEFGHRTPMFESVVSEAMQLVRELMQLDGNKEVMFLHGGASTQFFQVPMNFLTKGKKAAYLDGGVWGSKAIKEAKLFGDVEVVASSKDRNYSYIPTGYTIPDNAAYFHYTTNNTIEGTQMQGIPSVSAPLIADMSSDILSCSMDFNRFSFIYAGAQKNIGAAGVNLVVADKDFLETGNKAIPSMMDYRQHVANGSMLNTPPVFAIYVCLLTLRWLKKIGGVSAIETINNQKAELLYSTLESIPMFNLPVPKQVRSKMNAVFTMQDPALEKHFLARCKEEGMVGIKGHRSVGGFRVSMYNALPLSSVVDITALIKDFANKHA